MSGSILVDRRLWRARRRRLLRGGRHPLHVELAESMADRLGGIRRTFSSVLILGAGQTIVENLAEWLEERVGSGNLLFVADGNAELGAACNCVAPVVVLDEDALPFAPGWADLVVGALTLHWVNDLVGSLVQIRLCMKPDGLFLGALFGGATLHELRECLAEAEIECTGGLGLRVAPMAGIRDLGDALQRAGFALPVVDSEHRVLEFRDIIHLMRDLRCIGETNALGSRGGPLRRDVLARAQALYRERFPAPDGGILATFDVLHLCGWSPHVSQQQPLRPGSATARLADALGTREISAGERAGQPYGPAAGTGDRGERRR